MKTNIFIKTSDENQEFALETVGGRHLSGMAVFGQDEFELICFKVGKYEKIPPQSVRNAEKIHDYYFSASTAVRNGYCTADGTAYTEAVSKGMRPTCNVDDAKLVKTAPGCCIGVQFNRIAGRLS